MCLFCGVSSVECCVLFGCVWAWCGKVVGVGSVIEWGWGGLLSGPCYCGCCCVVSCQIDGCAAYFVYNTLWVV